MSAEYNRFTSNSLEYAVDLVNVGVKTPHQLPNPLLTILKTPKHTALQAGGRGFESLSAHNQKVRKPSTKVGGFFRLRHRVKLSVCPTLLNTLP